MTDTALAQDCLLRLKWRFIYEVLPLRHGRGAQMAQFFQNAGGEQSEKRPPPGSLWLTSLCSWITEISGLKISLISDAELQVKVLSAGLNLPDPISFPLVLTKPEEVT